MYDPTIGRWLSEDPLGFDAGDSNLYRYVGNNPATATDPSGMDPWDTRIEARLQRSLERQRNAMLATPNGSWPVQVYLNRMLNLNNDDWRETQRGCIGLVNVRFGFRYSVFPCVGNQGFADLPRPAVSWFKTYAQADAARNQLLQANHGGAQPRIFAICFQALTVPVAVFNQPGRAPLPSDVDLRLGYDFWSLCEPPGQPAYWEHISQAWNNDTNAVVIHTPLQDGIQNRGRYPYMIFGVFLTQSPNMPPGPNCPAR